MTGAGRGIGRAVAIRLSSQGCRVALTSRTKDELNETARLCAGEVLVLPADITSNAAIDKVFGAVESYWEQWKSSLRPQGCRQRRHL